jgi:crotonobetaine/carnitine-CoA ligase
VRLSTAEVAEILRRQESLPGLFAASVAERPDHPVLRFEGRDVTYVELDGLANRIANGLTAAGVGDGDRVAVMMSNSVEWVAFWFGAAKIGAITVPVNTAYKGDGLAYLLGHSRSKLLIADAEFTPRLAQLEGFELPLVAVAGSSPDAVELPGAFSFAELISGSDGRPDGPSLEPRSPCALLYTSGTTGPPKGCLLPHGQYVSAAHLHAANCGYDHESVIYSCLPLFHINAQNYSLLSVIAAGGTYAMDAKFTASGFWERLIETRATAFNFIGAMAIALWNRDPRPAELEHEAKIAFGVPVPLPIWHQWEERFGVRIVYAYGMTENGLPTLVPVEDTPTPERLRGAGGQETATSEVRIFDDDDLPVPPGTLGEIVTRPKLPWTMMLEYVDRPDATLEAFRNCWFHTGDLGYMTEDGYLFFADRKKDALRRRGEMVSSWEVEAVVSRFPGVEECAVVGVPSEMTEDDILVAVVCSGEPIEPAELVAFCKERTAYFQVPRYVRIVTELPRTQTQRVEKYRLREEGVTPDTFDVERVVAST